MTAILRRTPGGYRTTMPLECPGCHHAFDVSARVAEDREGKHFVMWAVDRPQTGYTRAELDFVVNGPPSEHTGVALPQPPGRVRMLDDPVPDFRERTP